jgi:1,4-alpha-glucan branching enzyme
MIYIHAHPDTPFCILRQPSTTRFQVCVAGNFNDWSGDATPLHRLDDGSFAADVPLPWGEKQAFKYVVDGGMSPSSYRGPLADVQNGRSVRMRPRNGVSFDGV